MKEYAAIHTDAAEEVGKNWELLSSEFGATTQPAKTTKTPTGQKTTGEERHLLRTV